MVNKIIFLGTGGDSIVVGKQMRSSGGIVLQMEDNQFLLDPGPGCLVKAREFGVNIRDTAAVLVSHGHTNHANDLNAVLEAMSVSGLDRIGVLITSKKVANGDDKEGPILRKRSHDFVEKVLDLDAGGKVGINDITIRLMKTDHFDSDALGFIFEAAKYSIGFTSDTEYSDAIAEQYKGCDILILNCKHPFGTRSPGHMNAEDAAKFFKMVKPKLAIITHFGVKVLESDPLYVSREIQRLSGVEVLAAKDGFSFNPINFTVDVKKTVIEGYK